LSQYQAGFAPAAISRLGGLLLHEQRERRGVAVQETFLAHRPDSSPLQKNPANPAAPPLLQPICACRGLGAWQQALTPPVATAQGNRRKSALYPVAAWPAPATPPYPPSPPPPIGAETAPSGPGAATPHCDAAPNAGRRPGGCETQEIAAVEILQILVHNQPVNRFAARRLLLLGDSWFERLCQHPS